MKSRGVRHLIRCIDIQAKHGENLEMVRDCNFFSVCGHTLDQQHSSAPGGRGGRRSTECEEESWVFLVFTYIVTFELKTQLM